MFYYDVSVNVKTIANDTETIAKTISNDIETIAKTIAKLPDDLTETQKAIISQILTKPEITQAELSQVLGMSVIGIRYVMKQLKEKGIVYRNGSNRNGYWIVKI